MVLLSPTQYPVLHASLISIMILLALSSSLVTLIANKKFLKGPLKSYITFNILSSLTLLLFFISFLFFEMGYHKIINLNDTEPVISFGFVFAIISFILAIIASVKLYKLSDVFGFSRKG